MAKRIFIVWLLVIPFVVFNSAFEGPKVLIFWIGSFVLFLVWILKLGLRVEKLLTRSDYYYLLWLGILTLTSFLGVHPLESITGGSYRHQGVIFFVSLWVVGKTIGLLTKDQKSFLYKAFFIAGGIEGAILIAQRLHSPNEPLGTFGNPNAAAGFVALTLFLPKGSLAYFGKIIIYLFSSTAILVSGSFTAAFVVISFILNKKLFIVILTILATGTVILGGRREFNNPYEGRGIIWKLAVVSIRAKPILGYGAESGEVVFDEAFRVYGTRLEGLIVDRAHNVFFDVAMWSGIPGLMLFVLWIYQKFRESRDKWRFAALIGWIVFASIQPLGVVHWLMFVIFLF